MARTIGIEDLAQRWGMHTKSVYRLVHRGDLGTIQKVAGRLRFRLSKVHRYELKRWGAIQDEVPHG